MDQIFFNSWWYAPLPTIILGTSFRQWVIRVFFGVNDPSLGSRLIEFQSQNMTVAARAIAEKKVSG
ncbi:hypothetical protein, partial [Tabrizicola soli]